MNRTRRIDPKTFGIGFPRGCLPLQETNASETQPDCRTVFTVATAFLSSFSPSFVGIVAFLRFFVWLCINLVMREQTLIPGFAALCCFVNLTLGRMPIFTRRPRASAFQMISARLSENGNMVTFALDTSLDTLQPREKDGSEGVAASWSGFCARSLLSCWQLHWSPLNTGLFLSTGNNYLPLSTPLQPFRLLTTAPVSIFPCLASKFRNRSF